VDPVAALPVDRGSQVSNAAIGESRSASPEYMMPCSSPQAGPTARKRNLCRDGHPASVFPTQGPSRRRFRGGVLCKGFDANPYAVLDILRLEA